MVEYEDIRSFLPPTEVGNNPDHRYAIGSLFECKEGLPDLVIYDTDWSIKGIINKVGDIKLKPSFYPEDLVIISKGDRTTDWMGDDVEVRRLLGLERELGL